MAPFSKFKLLFVIKLNFNGGQSKKNIKFWLFHEKIKIQFEIIVIEFWSLKLKILSILIQILELIKKTSPGWMGGWVDGFKSLFKACLQQSKIGIQNTTKSGILNAQNNFLNGKLGI